MTVNNSSQEALPSDREKWETDKTFREREIAVKEREQANREAELDLKRKEQASSGWRNPLVVAIIAATLAAVGNAVVSVVNGNLQRRLENEKSEQTRILEMIKTGDPDKAATNLEFLLEAGLISDSELQAKLREFLTQRKPGSGPTLPTQTSYAGGIVGADEAQDVNKLTTDNTLTKASKAVGRILIVKKGEAAPTGFCTAFLVSEELLLTASYCLGEADSAKLLMYDGSQEESYEIDLPAVEASDVDISYKLLRVKGKPGLKYGTLSLSTESPRVSVPLSLIMFRGSNQKLVVAGSPDCRVISVEKNEFHHLCDTGPGSSGAPVMSADGSYVLGIHAGRDNQGGKATRVDAVLRVSKTLKPGN
jgi:V8-like Glu-specific endopeptidase